MRLIDADAAYKAACEGADNWDGGCSPYRDDCIREEMDKVPTASPWHRVEDELPKEPGEYIVAYHPCWWDDVKTKVTKVGVDNFRGKSAWAKKKFQRVTHWMEKPKPPKEDA